jgi:NADPH:quinone reductase-like Zn-dependent oxidoreductase
LLAAAGAEVIATGLPDDAGLLRDLGASQVVGYAGYPSDVDLAFNLVLPSDELTGVASAVRTGGRLYTITFPPPRPEFLDRDDIGFELVLDLDGGLGGMREVAGLTATIGRRYRLDEGVRAIEDFGARHTVGKLVVSMA